MTLKQFNGQRSEKTYSRIALESFDRKSTICADTAWINTLPWTNILQNIGPIMFENFIQVNGHKQDEKQKSILENGLWKSVFGLRQCH